MIAIGSLLAVTDFSEGAERAARRAAALAGELGARLELLHVVSAQALAELRTVAPDGGGPAAEKVLGEARRLMEALASELRPAAARVEVGEVPEALLEAATAHDLLVLGSQGVSPLRHAVLGSTADRMLLAARRPMLVVKREPGGAYRRVLVPCEYAPPARRALEAALHVAPRALVTLVHAFEVEFEGRLWRGAVSREKVAELRSQAEERTRAWLLGLREGLDAARIHVEAPFGKARAVVPAMAASMEADLVVMGKQGRSMAREMFLGSVTRQVLADVECDVLVLPAR
jgi:nucleotide-binding universal stress UspA family protein